MPLPKIVWAGLVDLCKYLSGRWRAAKWHRLPATENQEPMSCIVGSL